jgi:hypothetical protein
VVWSYAESHEAEGYGKTLVHVNGRVIDKSQDARGGIETGGTGPDDGDA